MYESVSVVHVAHLTVHLPCLAFCAGFTETFSLWKKVGIAGTALCGVMAVYDLVTEEHDHKHKFYPHEHVRLKKFPWAASDCDFFDLKCSAKWKESH